MGGSGTSSRSPAKTTTVIWWPASRAPARPPPAASSPCTCARSTAWTWRWRPATCTAPPWSSLIKIGGQAGAHVYEQGTGRDPVDIAEWALDQAKQDRRDALIVDTSGRLHVDEELMKNSPRSRRPHQTARRAAGGRRDDRPGRRRRGGAVRRGGELRRRGAVEAGRRLARRRGAVGQGRDRQADPVRLHRREAGRLRALPPGPGWPSASSAWAT